jgi:hypothetical protein
MKGEIEPLDETGHTHSRGTLAAMFLRFSECTEVLTIMIEP